MLVAAGQFAVTPDWRANAQTCVALMAQAAEQGASLLVLPEALAGARPIATRISRLNRRRR
ncbi:Uncharacterised protein [Raoultella terrigena]|uniref:CN hydrolase domain-containing protein n=1 Tax=Raoultella terrigena TaxID=577 RepID=A0A485BA05_RAOTE|nr:Uncharacterised protein [Raoultella terrigena]